MQRALQNPGTPETNPQPPLFAELCVITESQRPCYSMGFDSLNASLEHEVTRDRAPYENLPSSHTGNVNGFQILHVTILLTT